MIDGQIEVINRNTKKKVAAIDLETLIGKKIAVYNGYSWQMDITVKGVGEVTLVKAKERSELTPEDKVINDPPWPLNNLDTVLIAGDTVPALIHDQHYGWNEDRTPNIVKMRIPLNRIKKIALPDDDGKYWFQKKAKEDHIDCDTLASIGVFINPNDLSYMKEIYGIDTVEMSFDRVKNLTPERRNIRYFKKVVENLYEEKRNPERIYTDAPISSQLNTSQVTQVPCVVCGKILRSDNKSGLCRECQRQHKTSVNN